MIVADTNTIAYLIIPGEHTQQALAVFQKDTNWVAPLLWWSEFRNILSIKLHREHISLHQAIEFMEMAETVMQNAGYKVNSSQVLDLSLNSGCTAYDCEFVALAQDLGIPVVTSDQKIIKSFPDIAISMEAFII